MESGDLKKCIYEAIKCWNYTWIEIACWAKTLIDQIIVF